MSSNKDVMTATAYLEQFVRGSNVCNEELQALNEKRGGTYTSGVLAAIVAGSAPAFKKAVDMLEDDIRDNVEGIAVQLKCSLDKAGKKFKIPSGLSALKSIMLSAFELQVDIGSAEEPRPFTKIREDVRIINQAAKDAALTGDEKTLLDFVTATESLASNAKRMIASDVAAMLPALLLLRDKSRELVQAAEVKAAAAAEAEAKAKAEAKAEAAAEKAAKAEAAAKLAEAKAAEAEAAIEAAKAKAKATTAKAKAKAKAAKSKARTKAAKAASAEFIAKDLAAAA